MNVNIAACRMVVALVGVAVLGTACTAPDETSRAESSNSRTTPVTSPTAEDGLVELSEQDLKDMAADLEDFGIKDFDVHEIEERARHQCQLSDSALAAEVAKELGALEGLAAIDLDTAMSDGVRRVCRDRWGAYIDASDTFFANRHKPKQAAATTVPGKVPMKTLTASERQQWRATLVMLGAPNPDMVKTEKLTREMCQMTQEKLIASVLALNELEPGDAVRYEMQFGASITTICPTERGRLSDALRVAREQATA